MKIFALETNVDNFRKEYLVKEEEVELLLTHFHWLKFFLRAGIIVLLTLAVLFLYLFIVLSFQGTFIMFTTLFVGWVVFAVYQILKSYISYRYSYILVTSEKIIIIQQNSLFNQRINPVPFDSVVSTDTSSQFFGLCDCGLLVLNLAERTQYSSKQVQLRYVPRVNGVAGIIESGMVLEKNRLAYKGDLPDKIVDNIQKKAKVIEEKELLNAIDPKIDSKKYK